MKTAQIGPKMAKKGPFLGVQDVTLLRNIENMVYDRVQNDPIFGPPFWGSSQNDPKGMERHVQNTRIPKKLKKGSKKGSKIAIHSYVILCI